MAAANAYTKPKHTGSIVKSLVSGVGFAASIIMIMTTTSATKTQRLVFFSACNCCFEQRHKTYNNANSILKPPATFKLIR